MSERLIVIDMNGVLIFRTKRTISVRPYVLPFLEVLCSHFKVGFWSSMLSINLEKALNTILRESQTLKKDDFLFLWGQDKCEGRWPNFKKPLCKIVAEFPQFEDNILMIDDSPEKFTEEDRGVLCTPLSWEKSMKDDSFLDPKGPFATWLLELSSSSLSVRSFIDDYPTMPWVIEKEKESDHQSDNDTEENEDNANGNENNNNDNSEDNTKENNGNNENNEDNEKS